MGEWVGDRKNKELLGGSRSFISEGMQFSVYRQILSAKCCSEPALQFINSVALGKFLNLSLCLKFLNCIVYIKMIILTWN